MIEIITGDLLEATEKYIGHQCNILTTNSAGIAKAIFDKFPYANTYATRPLDENGKTIANPGLLGNIDILGNGKDQRFVINMYAQYYPGKPKFPKSTLDGIPAREKYFYHCLLRIAKIPDLESIAFPFGIGCGLADGINDRYLQMINNFSNYVYETQKARVCLYKLHN